MLDALVAPWALVLRVCCRVRAAWVEDTRRLRVQCAAYPERSVAALLRITDSDKRMARRTSSESSSQNNTHPSTWHLKKNGIDTPIFALTAILNASSTAGYDSQRTVSRMEAEWDGYQRAVRCHPVVYSTFFQHHEASIEVVGTITELAFRNTTLRNIFSNRLWHLTAGSVMRPVFLSRLQEVLLEEEPAQRAAPVARRLRAADPPVSSAARPASPSRPRRPHGSSASPRPASATRSRSPSPPRRRAPRSKRARDDASPATLPAVVHDAFDAFARAHAARLGDDRRRAAVLEAALVVVDAEGMRDAMRASALQVDAIAPRSVEESSAWVAQYAIYYRGCTLHLWAQLRAEAVRALDVSRSPAWVQSTIARLNACLATAHAHERASAGDPSARVLAPHQLDQRRQDLVQRFRREAATATRDALVATRVRVQHALAAAAIDVPDTVRDKLVALGISCDSDVALLDPDAARAETHALAPDRAPHHDDTVAHARDASWNDAVRASMREDENRREVRALNECRKAIGTLEMDPHQAPQRVIELCDRHLVSDRTLAVTAVKSRTVRLLENDAEAVRNINFHNIDITPGTTLTFAGLLRIYERGFDTVLVKACQAARDDFDRTRTTYRASAHGAGPLDVVLRELGAEWDTEWVVDAAAWSTFRIALALHAPDVRLSHTHATEPPTMEQLLHAMRVHVVSEAQRAR